ncbi:MAG: hypothetical protein WCY82_10290 [Desulfotomaculaceae bacterium]
MARINLRLKPGRDNDLIAWWNSIPEGDRSYFLRETLRRGLGGQAGGYQAPPIAAAGPLTPRAPMLGSGKAAGAPAPNQGSGREDREESPEALEAALANLTNSF